MIYLVELGGVEPPSCTPAIRILRV